MIQTVFSGRKADLGHGLVVQRLLPHAQQRAVGPFVFFDHAGPVRMAAEAARAADVRPHPHIGLSTVSYLLSGSVTHRDSLGVEQVITPGDVNWMTAGRGIAHSERFEDTRAMAEAGLELLQFWVGLPESHEETAPAFVHHASASLPVAEEGGAWLRLIAGSAYGLDSPAQGASPLFYAHLRLPAGARWPWPSGHVERAAYVVTGEVELAGQVLVPGQLAVAPPGAAPDLVARQDAVVMLLGGEPLGNRFLWWNFVSSRKERIEQAKADWEQGRFVLPPQDHHEFIPLPQKKS
ncbi:MAG: Quercetin 2,3-dioxygenase [Paracidovorax wautersii]|uniref:Quercetin 2,3-dioxygenase n=1 Tax=Paracidovorax wautersii TaxID=1177982 RepID=A0A7V8FMD7_9BURK|nr:MAG: Quercetin 2,3-dioxygenase [Paracidovorax wautersii]